MALKAAVVGMGGIGNTHARCYHEDPLSELVAVCDIDKAKADAIMSHFPVGHPGEPDDIAAATCYLASDDAKFAVGMVMTVDGGWICGYNRDL